MIARLLTNDFGRMMGLSVVIGAFCGLGGIYLSYFVNAASGATVVLFSAALFVIALAYNTARSRLAVMRGKSRLNAGSMIAADDSHIGD